MEEHVVVVATATIIGEADACTPIPRDGPRDIEGSSPFLLGVELDIEFRRGVGERRHLGGDVDRTAHAWAGPALNAGWAFDDIDGINAIEADGCAVAIKSEAVA